MSSNFLLINDQPVSLEQVLRYLQDDGAFQPFLASILRQHVIAQKLKLEPDLMPSPEAVKHYLLEQVLGFDPDQEEKRFQQWLTDNNMSYEQLWERISQTLLLQNLIDHISQPKLHEYFIKHKQKLDKYLLSCILVEQETLAEELHDQIKAGESFEQLAQDYSIAENHTVGGQMEPISPSDLPDELRIAIAKHPQPGSLIGPIAIPKQPQPGSLIGPTDQQNRWYLFRLEQILPSALEGELEAQLKAEIYQEWLSQEIAAITVKMQVTQWLSLKTSIL